MRPQKLNNSQLNWNKKQMRFYLTFLSDSDVWTSGSSSCNSTVDAVFLFSTTKHQFPPLRAKIYLLSSVWRSHPPYVFKTSRLHIVGDNDVLDQQMDNSSYVLLEVSVNPDRILPVSAELNVLAFWFKHIVQRMALSFRVLWRYLLW